MAETDRIRYGNEHDYYPFDSDVAHYLARDSDRCHDCQVEQGELHQKGCDVEQCPVCETQLISCEHGPALLE